jgi:hypothetical protein
MSTKDLYTAGKIAKEFGLTGKAVKAAIEELKITPDVIKGNCKYYTRETAEKIKEKAPK